MRKFLDIYNLLKMMAEEMKNQNNLTLPKGIKSTIKNLPQRVKEYKENKKKLKFTGTDAFNYSFF